MHEIFSGLLEATTKEEAIEEVARIKSDIEEHGYYDYGGDCYYHDEVFNTEEEAEEFLSKGLGEGGICKVKDVKESSSLKKAKEKLNALYQKEQDYDKEFKQKLLEKFKERTSATCSCSECESRYKKEIAIQYNLYCPVCRNWMVPDGVKDSYNKAKDKFKTLIETTEKQIKEQRIRDAANSNKIRYFYLLDYHF